MVISVREKELILRRAQKGDPEALNLLFESCRGKLFARALRILPRGQDAEDAVQDAMLAAFTHLDQFEGRADFLSWATRIVINAALTQIRKTQSRPAISWDQVNGGIEGSFTSEFLEEQKPTPEQMYQQVEHAGGNCQGTGGAREHMEGPLTSRSAVIVSQVQRQNTTSPRRFSE